MAMKAVSFESAGLVLSLVLIVVSLVFPFTAYCQLTTATIVGTVADQSGSVVPGAQITVTNTDTGVTYSPATSRCRAGEYSARFLPPGNYK